jgi:hypothetical protein
MLQYLIRLDDLCPTNDLAKWERFFNLFDKYNIKPIIAVIPDNQDPKLKNCGDINPNYWQLVRDLQKKGYIIGMHGFDHCYVNHNSGLLKINKRSEFAGLPFHIQEEKIKAAAAIFKREGIHSSLFIAPAHTFDRNTLLALNKYTDIKIISDGLLKSPYIRFGFNWIPVQLSEVEPKTKNTWTFNYHPETCSNKTFHELEIFLAIYHENFVSLDDLSFGNFTWKDNLMEKYCIYKRLGRDFINDIISFFEKIPA